MEFLKNFLYDVSDTVIKLIVVIVMVFVIAFKLNTAMPDIDMFGQNTNQEQTVDHMEQKSDDGSVISIDLTDSSIGKDASNTQGQAQTKADVGTKTDADSKPNEQKQIALADQKKPDGANAQTGAQTNAKANENQQKPEEKPDAKVDPKKAEQTKPKTEEEIKTQDNAKKKTETQRATTKIVIESGYTSEKIAAVLVSNKIIKDAKAFLDVVAELGYTSKLRSGTFYLSSDMTYEEIANKLVGR